MKFSLVLLLIPVLVLAQTKEFTVLDSTSKIAIPYAKINFLNGFGVFANAEGKVEITDAAIEKMEISSLGYTAIVIEAANLKSEVYLNPKPIELEEVIVTKSKTKNVKQHVVKPVIHQRTSELYMSGIGLQYAFNVPYREAYISEIALPLIEIAFESEGRPGVFKKIQFRTLIKIELLENDNGLPGSKLNNFEQFAIIDNTGKDNKSIIILDEYIEIPVNGLFVQFTIVGRADEKGVLINELPYTISKLKDGTDYKFIKYCQPNFPLVERPKGPLTLVRYSFDDQPKWRTIDEPHLHQVKDYPDFNIGFGYTTVSK